MGTAVRRPRRRRPARPGRHQLLRRVDDLLQEPGRGIFADQTVADRPGRSQPVPARLRHRPVRRQQRRPARPGPDQRPRDRQSARFPPGDARPAPDRRRSTAGWSTSPQQPGPPGRVPRIGRGLAAGDLDNDGRLDLVVVPQNSPLVFFHNQTRRAATSSTFRLEGTRSNRDARRRGRHGHGRRPAPPRLAVRRRQLPVGLRPAPPLRPRADRIEEVEVRWPSGQVDRLRNIQADRGYRLREGEAKPVPLGGF